jgi:acetyl-CoA carboxylase carboxyltransferase component
MKLAKQLSLFAFAINSTCYGFDLNEPISGETQFTPLTRSLTMKARNIPILFLHNVTGFMVGPKAEHAGIIKMGAQLVSAISCSTVPHISIIVGASYGAGNYAMCGRSYRPRFLFAWPTARCSVMGPDQLAGVMETVQRASAKSKGEVTSPERMKAQVDRFRREATRDAECYATSSMLIDDGIIDPRDTRHVLRICLDVMTSSGVWGTPSHRLLARI